MEYKGEGFVSGLATSGKGVPRVGYVGAGCTQGRVWLGEWLGWFVTDVTVCSKQHMALFMTTV